jgi:S1-C subfamily serine protease
MAGGDRHDPLSCLQTRISAMTRFVLPTIAAAMLSFGVPSRSDAQRLTPREIAATAQAATVQVRAMNSRGTEEGQGSGFFVSPDGLIVTNFHVIDGAQALQVETAAGEVYDNVYYVTADPRRDLAVLKVPVEGATSLRLGSDTAAVIGAEVYAMGNPLGLTGTFSDGLVSAHRTLEGVSMIQISAPISPGSSGGPVMDERGEVIGVATLIMTGGQNLNYAVPVRYVRPLLSTGDVPQRYSASLLPRSAGELAALGAERRPGSGSSPGSRRDGASIPDRVNEWEEQVLGFLEPGEAVMDREGWVRSHEYETGAIGRGQYETLSFPLAAGTAYTFIGACDTDCDDLDFRLYSPSGALLESDVASDDFPTVGVVTQRSGVYKLRVGMARCDTEVCYYAVAAYTMR